MTRRLHLKMRCPDGRVDIVPVTSEEHFESLIGSGYAVVRGPGGDTPETVTERANRRYPAPGPITFAGSVRFHTSRART